MTKARQSSKIRELGDALVTAGFVTLDKQAQAIGLCRSTTWTILKGNHKTSGLSATVINRMLAAPQLHPLVRQKILEYIEEKAAGLYGHRKISLRRFVARLSVKPFDPVERNWSRNIMSKETDSLSSRSRRKSGPSGMIFRVLKRPGQAFLGPRTMIVFFCSIESTLVLPALCGRAANLYPTPGTVRAAPGAALEQLECTGDDKIPDQQGMSK